MLNKLVNVVSEVPQGSVLGPQWFLLYTAELFSRLVNKLYGYANDLTLVAVMPSPAERVAVIKSMNHDLNRVSLWCDLWGIKLYASTTKTTILSRSRKIHPHAVNPFDSGLNCAERIADLFILGVTFDGKITFDKHIRSIFSAAAQRLVIMRKSLQVFHDRSLLLKDFGTLSCRSWSIAQQCGARLPIYILNSVVGGAGFSAGGGLE